MGGSLARRGAWGHRWHRRLPDFQAPPATTVHGEASAEQGIHPARAIWCSRLTTEAARCQRQPIVAMVMLPTGVGVARTLPEP